MILLKIIGVIILLGLFVFGWYKFYQIYCKLMDCANGDKEIEERITTNLGYIIYLLLSMYILSTIIWSIVL